MDSNPSFSLSEYLPNVLLITGSGRERGKTMLACNIISRWKENHDIIAIKISTHIHEHPRSVNLIHRSDGYAIWEEKAMSPKDSGRFLEAGAVKAFYIETSDHELVKAFRFICGLCSEKSLIICESGGLGRSISPGVMLFVQHVDDIVGTVKETLRNLSHRIVYSSSPELSDPSLIIKITDHRWKLVTREQPIPSSSH